MKKNCSSWPRIADTKDVIQAEWLIHKIANSKIVILYFHGGGYIVGNRKLDRSITYQFSMHAKVSTFSVDYRLAPRYPFPCAVIDAISAYMYLLELGIEAKRIVISGISAGGGLAIATLLAIKNMNLSCPAGSCVLSPWVRNAYIVLFFIG